ncbi:MAG: penicillin acylase family protein [Cyclobacteriaceae bacterium]
MKTFRFVVALILAVGLSIVFNSSISGIPPLGKFLSPFHGYLQNTKLYNYEAELNFDELEADVKVYFDELDIPHIYASNSSDLHFVQGYLTAKDRLWQMDFYSRLIYGRLSEVLGNRTLKLDQMNRRIGLNRITETAYNEIKKDPELLSVIQSYTRGVNAYIETLSYAKLPIEFKLLNYNIEPWTEQKTCMVYALLSSTLSRGESDLENTNALSLFGKETFDLLFPERTGNIDPVIPKSETWDFAPIKQPTRPENISFINESIKTIINKPSSLIGSNNFVVSGQKSYTGNVLLANEPDLELTQPSIWHAAHLHTPEMNVMGVTVPGAPLILIGFNDSIAWGVTNSPRDQVDWYKVQFRNSQRDEYFYNDQWFKTSKIIEEISIKGEDPLIDTIVMVHHGPIVYDRNFLAKSGKTNYAMRWVAHLPNQSTKSLYNINKAKNYEEFEDALKYFGGPPQNIIFGSVQGDIAMNLPGKFPIKWPEQGKFLMDGSNPQMEPNNFIPFEHRLKSVNPTQGFLSSANQHPVDSTYTYYTYANKYEYYRNRRINDRLNTLNIVNVNAMKRLQNDNFNYHAYEVLPFMLEQLDTLSLSFDQSAIAKELKSWDYFNEVNLKSPIYFQIWWDLVYDQMWDEFDTITNYELTKPGTYESARILTTLDSLKFYDIVSTQKTESRKDLITVAYEAMFDSLQVLTKSSENLSWSQFKSTNIDHFLKLKPFSFKEVSVGGYKNIVNAASQKHGPSWRMVVELDPAGVKAWGVYPGSQTGNPADPDYGQMVDNWANGEYYQLLFGQDIADSEKVVIEQKFNAK